MKKVLLSLAMLGIMLVPATTHASIFRAGEIETLSSEEVIDENVYLAGASVYIDAPVLGDVFVAGSTVNIDSTIKGDLFAAGANLTINSDVEGDVRVAGANVQINGTITGELIVAGGAVQLLPGAVIQGDVRGAAGEFYNAASIEGEAVIGAELLRQNGSVGENLTLFVADEWRIGDEAQVGGVLEYSAPQAVQIGEGVATEVVFTQIEIDHKEEVDFGPVLAGMAAAWVITKYLAFILAAVLLAWFAPKLAKKQSDETLSEFWYHALRGLAIILLVPLVGGILLMTGIGMVLGWVVFGLFSLMSVLAGVHATVTFGMWLRSISYPKSKKNKVDMNEITALIGAILLGGIALVPVIGWIFVFIWWLASLGALWTRWHKWFEKHRT